MKKKAWTLRADEKIIKAIDFFSWKHRFKSRNEFINYILSRWFYEQEHGTKSAPSRHQDVDEIPSVDNVVNTKPMDGSSDC